jgi:putative heme-binding domain-containing protein
MSLVELKDGRLLSGLVEGETDRTVTLQTPTERMILQRSAIERIQSSDVSMMPEGQIEAMNDQTVRDLIAYLMSPQPIKVNDVSASQ